MSSPYTLHFRVCSGSQHRPAGAISSFGVEAVGKAIFDLLRPIQRARSDWWLTPECIRRAALTPGGSSEGVSGAEKCSIVVARFAC